MEKRRAVKWVRGRRGGEVKRAVAAVRVGIGTARFGWRVCFWLSALRDEQGLCSLRSLALEAALACTHRQNLS